MTIDNKRDSPQRGKPNPAESCDSLCDSCESRGTCSDPRAEISDRMGRIKHKILIGSGKGGVGKSTVTVNLAMVLKRSGYRVGILDADITGPNIPKLLGIEDLRLTAGPGGVEPVNADGIKVVSMALVLSSRDSAVVWRGPMKMAALKQFISDVNWGDLDFLLVDLPPGTSDEPISLAQLIPDLTGAVIVTTPQEVAILDSKKAVNMFQLMNVPILGIIENMSTLICPHCGQMIDVFKSGGGEREAREMGLHFLGAIPIDPEIGKLGDQGLAFVSRDTPAWKSFEKVVSALREEIAK
ncbi:MAG: Mrp/NBP35 family ATP-binding protein [Methanosarcinales archaeon]|nr:Mrp/NBP35 family ATP-binding protein [Methanosarcinales archaeon]